MDIGCGSGYFLSKISKYIPNSIGIESHEYSNKKYNDIKKCNIFDNGFEIEKITCFNFFLFLPLKWSKKSAQNT